MFRAIWVYILLATMTVACMPTADNDLPEYVVILTPLRGQYSHCTGIAIDARTIVSAYHCNTALRRAVTVDGQEVGVLRWQAWPDHDIAVYRALQPLNLSTYAQLSNARYLYTGTVYGACPRYMITTPRHMSYLFPSFVYMDGFSRSADQWYIYDREICGGDSGGPVIQDGRVVGMISAAHKTANTAWSIPAETIQDLLSTHDTVNQSRPIPTIQPHWQAVNP